jgi:glucokinase
MYVAVDQVGTNTRIAVIADLDVPNVELLVKFPTFRAYDEQIPYVVSTIRNRVSGVIRGIGLTVGAQIIRDGSCVEASNMLPDYIGKPIVGHIAEALRVPVRLANDNVCALIAESRFGALMPYQRAAYMTVSTGTGGALRFGQGGHETIIFSQLGHQILQPDGERCLCGQVGCLQTISGGRQIERRFGKAAALVEDEAFWLEAVENLAIGIVNVSWIAKIDAIAVGGAIALGNRTIQERLAGRVAELRVGVPEFHVHFPQLGTNAPLLGAALLFSADRTIFH